MVKTLPSNAGGAGSIPSQGAKISHAYRPKNQNIKKKKQYCNKFNKDLKYGSHQKIFKNYFLIKKKISGVISLVAQLLRSSLVAQAVESMPAMQETQVQSLGREDPLEKEMAAHSSILAWRIPLTEEPGGLQSMGSQRVGHD